MDRENQKETDQVRLRPYEKFMKFGAVSLTESELLAVILRTGTREEDVEALAAHILKLADYDRLGLTGLHHLTMEPYHKNSPSRARTYNPTVNSRVLYH